MAEEFLEGPQVSTESIVLDGVAHTPGFSGRNYELLGRYAPYMIENGAELPSHLPVATQEAVRAVVQRAAAAMGIRCGVVKGDIVVSGGEPRVIEIAARLSGRYFCTREIRLDTGVDFVGAAIRLAVGKRVDPADLTPRLQRGVAQRCLFPRPGRVTRLVDAVIPHVPVRQWVLTFPYRLRHVLAWNHGLCPAPCSLSTSARSSPLLTAAPAAAVFLMGRAGQSP